ncbi:hypothetical protein LJB82_02290 [Desulfovibrio sp. OttesenSCG-928-M16]|nr:hypothetical protein [Desulfovibrio sp. OttesenSCG-928-M16]
MILSPWRQYTGNYAELPTPFLPVLVYKGGEDGALIGVFSAYRPGKVPVWMAHNTALGAFPVEPGDRWIPYPEAQEDES